MNHHDPQNTGRSGEQGPSSGIVEWELEQIQSTAGVSVTGDSNCIFTQYTKITAADLSGNIKWESTSGIAVLSTPIVTSFGVIYFTSNVSVTGVDYSGNILWEKEFRRKQFTN